jgi:ribosome modulation factor
VNRRQFLQFTVALGVAAALPAAFPATYRWIPTDEEVDRWLEYYKICRTTGQQKSFAKIVGEAFPGEMDAQERKLLRAAETEFARLGELPLDCRPHSAYEAGINGLPRYCGDFTVPSHRAFAWYNGWRIGNDDRLWREMKKARRSLRA